MHDPPVLAPRDQPGALEDREMLHEARERHRRVLGERPDRGRAARKPLDDGAAGRVGKRREDAVEVRRASGGLIVNHMV